MDIEKFTARAEISWPEACPRIAKKKKKLLALPFSFIKGKSSTQDWLLGTKIPIGTAPPNKSLKFSPKPTSTKNLWTLHVPV